MKRSVRIVALASVAWLCMTVAALALDSRAADVAALLAGIALLAAVWLLVRATDRERKRWQQTLDALQGGVVLYDADDRLLLANADFRRLYRLQDAELAVGTPFETLLRRRVMAGLVPEAAGREEAWVAERAQQHRNLQGNSFLREMADGRWRRITEQRLPDGSSLGFSIDVTELVENQRALDAARHEAERAHRRLHDAVEAMPAAVEVYDRSDHLILFNRRLLALYPHMAAEGVLGETFDTLVRRALAQGKVPEAVGREQEWLAERLAQRGRRAEPLLQRAPDGAWTHIYETPMPEGGLVAVRLDASEIVQQREQLQAARDAADSSRATLHEAIEALPDGFALYDAQDRLVLCNQRYREIYSDSAPAIVAGATFEEIVRYGVERGQYPQARADPRGWLAERVRRHREPDGVAILQELEGNRWLRIDERRTQAGGIAGVRTDVTEFVRTRQQLEQLSATDPLTGLANRRRFDARLAEELLRAQRHATPLALLMIDIDHFKLYNDHHGHPQGDRALQAVAAVLAQQARRPGEVVARYGGEEFAILLPHAHAAAALTVADRCAAAMTTLALAHGLSPTAPHVTLSIGAAVHRTAEREDAAGLLRRADAALYAAKAAGRARCELAQEP